MFEVQFLLFLINMAIKYFGRILATFLGPESTIAEKVENRAQMTWFCTRNIPTLFGVQFSVFPISTAEKCFSRILMTFPGLDTTETGLETAKLKAGPD